jgi:hypothetical protein
MAQRATTFSPSVTNDDGSLRAHSCPMIGFSIPQPVQAVAIVAAIVGLFWISRRVEPHWVSKDGSRFTAKVQHLDEAGDRRGYWREVKVTVDDTTVVLLARGIAGGIGGSLGSTKSMLRRMTPVAEAATVARRIKPYARYEVDHRADKDTDGKAVFLLVGKKDGDFLAIRVPVKSRAVNSLEQIITPD